MRLALIPKRIDQLTGLDLIILEPEATLQDLVDALQPYASTVGEIHKLQLRGPGDCKGCVNNCCQTSIIAPDPIGFAAIARRLGLGAADFLAAHCDPDALARGQVRLNSFPCTFLSPERTCSIYEDRALICRLFLCCPLSPALENLIQNALGAGLAALARQLQQQGHLAPLDPDGYQATGERVLYEAGFDTFYRRWVGGEAEAQSADEQPPAMVQNPFDQATSYAEIPLWAFATADDWAALTRGGLPHPAEAPVTP